MTDKINPPHYQKGKIEVIEFILCVNSERWPSGLLLAVGFSNLYVPEVMTDCPAFFLIGFCRWLANEYSVFNCPSGILFNPPTRLSDLGTIGEILLVDQFAGCE